MSRLSRFHHSMSAGRRRQSESGQIVVEYVLLLIVAIAFALLITNMMVSRTDGSEGFVVSSWKRIIQAIATDKADGIDP